MHEGRNVIEKSRGLEERKTAFPFFIISYYISLSIEGVQS